MKNYAADIRRVGIGGTPRLCQDALVEMLRELFAGKTYNGQKGPKELTIIKQDLPIPKRQRDRRADTDDAFAPYIVVEMDEGVIPDDDSPQLVDFGLVICTYDRGTEREGYLEMSNIKEDIIQRLCARPYFGGAFTILKPISWAVQKDSTEPYYYGAVSLTCTAPAMTQDTELEDLV